MRKTGTRRSFKRWPPRLRAPVPYRERVLAEDLAARLGVRPRIRTDAGLQAGGYDIDNTDVDRLFPDRLRTPWNVGLALTWRAGVLER